MNRRVLMIGWELPPYNSGGLGVACLQIAKALAKKNIDITFVLPHKLNIKADFMDIVFADVEEGENKIVKPYLSYSEWVKGFGIKDDINPYDFVGGAVNYANNIIKIAKKYGVDIIHSHDWLTYPAAITAKKISKKPMVAHIHSTEMDRTGGHFPNQLVYGIEKKGFLEADKVLSVSQFTKNVLVSDYDIPSGKVEVVHNAAEFFERKNLPPTLVSFKKLGYKMVLFLGRITLMKGPEYFVKAASIVLKYNPKTLFVVVGSGEMQDYMVDEASRLGILDKFMFTGFLRGDDRDRIFQAADVFVDPSVAEPFGITTLEAIANETPVILSKQSGVSEILKNVLKVDFWDTDEIANKILAVLKYRSLPKDLKKESQKELKELTWEKSADKIIDVYNQLA